MKRFISLVLSLGMALSLTVSAQAAPAASLVRTFLYGDSLYTYVDISGTEAPITKADAQIEGRTFPASGTLETVRQAGFPVTWLLLVDNSNSMPPFREDVTAFARGLADACGENTHFSLASFGDQFVLLEEDIPAEQLPGAVDAIPMDETVTRLHSSIDAALDYLDGLPRSGSELRCLVVLSDAVQYDPNAAVSYEDLLEQINRSGVIVHSVGFGSDAAALKSLASLTEASGGIHQVAGGDLTASDAAAALGAAAGGLYVMGFSLSGFRPESDPAEVSVTFASGGELVCRGSAEVSFPPADTEGGEPGPAEEPGPALPPSDTASAGGMAGSQADADEEASSVVSPGTDLLLPILGVAVILAAVIAVLCLRRKKPRAAPAAPADASPESGPGQDGIYMRLEVLQGAYLGRSLEFTLSHELIIGRDAECDIPFADPSVSRRNSRVFLAGDAVYIEDLKSQNGTRVNGAALGTARLLRSGDQISVGDVSFRLKF